MFGIELIEYPERAGGKGRTGGGILLASGTGIGIALMDQFPHCRYFVDTDKYRTRHVDWEAFAVVMSSYMTHAVLAGWFTLDKPGVFIQLRQGFAVRSLVFEYRGGGVQSLGSFISNVNSYFE